MATWATWAPPVGPWVNSTNATHPDPDRKAITSESTPVRPAAGEMVSVVQDHPGEVVPVPVGRPRAYRTTCGLVFQRIQETCAYPSASMKNEGTALDCSRDRSDPPAYAQVAPPSPERKNFAAPGDPWVT